MMDYDIISLLLNTNIQLSTAKILLILNINLISVEKLNTDCKSIKKAIHTQTFTPHVYVIKWFVIMLCKCLDVLVSNFFHVSPNL